MPPVIIKFHVGIVPHVLLTLHVIVTLSMRGFINQFAIRYDIRMKDVNDTQCGSNFRTSFDYYYFTR